MNESRELLRELVEAWGDDRGNWSDGGPDRFNEALEAARAHLSAVEAPQAPTDKCAHEWHESEHTGMVCAKCYEGYGDRSAMDSAAGFYPASGGSIPPGRATTSDGARAAPRRDSDDACSSPGPLARLVSEGLSSGVRADRAFQPAGESGSLTTIAAPSAQAESAAPAPTDGLVTELREASDGLAREPDLEWLSKLLREAARALAERAPQAEPTRGVLPNGVDLRVIRAAYDWTVANDGVVLGLTAGDMGYAPTGIKLDKATCDALGLAQAEPTLEPKGNKPCE